jgi:hypothetical protein
MRGKHSPYGRGGLDADPQSNFWLLRRWRSLGPRAMLPPNSKQSASRFSHGNPSIVGRTSDSSFMPNLSDPDKSARDRLVLFASMCIVDRASAEASGFHDRRNGEAAHRICEPFIFIPPKMPISIGSMGQQPGSAPMARGSPAPCTAPLRINSRPGFLQPDIAGLMAAEILSVGGALGQHCKMLVAVQQIVSQCQQ